MATAPSDTQIDCKLSPSEREKISTWTPGQETTEDTFSSEDSNLLTQEKPTADTKVETRKSPDTFSGWSWATIIWFSVVYIGTAAAPFLFSWEGLALAVFMHWLTGGIGICLGYHRLLTHSSFTTFGPIRYLITWIGSLAGEGEPIQWIANHRKHHALSDQEGDPHSPLDGPWWSHMWWMVPVRQKNKEHRQRWAPDLMKEPMMRFLGAMFLPSQFIVGGLMAAAGYYWGGGGDAGWYMAMSFVAWGMFVRLTFVLHATWAVNSASHMWGYRNYETTDQSRNNWGVALITYGEGWHNNHHAYPRMANHGHRWWEIDVTFRFIRLMQFFGLAWDVVDYKQKKLADRPEKWNIGNTSEG